VIGLTYKIAKLALTHHNRLTPFPKMLSEFCYVDSRNCRNNKPWSQIRAGGRVTPFVSRFCHGGSVPFRRSRSKPVLRPNT